MSHYHGYYKTHEGYILTVIKISNAFLMEEIMGKQIGLHWNPDSKINSFSGAVSPKGTSSVFTNFFFCMIHYLG
jgi:hypothetical protein